MFLFSPLTFYRTHVRAVPCLMPGCLQYIDTCFVHSTALLLAYSNGNGGLCRALVRAGACLGTVNRNGLSIFSAPVATKQLLFKLLGGCLTAAL